MTQELICVMPVCGTAWWKHDEPVQLGGFWHRGGERPHPVLIGLRHQEGGADRQSVLLRGHRSGAQEPFIPVSDGAGRRRCCRCRVTRQRMPVLFPQIRENLPPARQVNAE